MADLGADAAIEPKAAGAGELVADGAIEHVVDGAIGVGDHRAEADGAEELEAEAAIEPIAAGAEVLVADGAIEHVADGANGVGEHGAEADGTVELVADFAIEPIAAGAVELGSGLKWVAAMSGDVCLATSRCKILGIALPWCWASRAREAASFAASRSSDRLRLARRCHAGSGARSCLRGAERTGSMRGRGSNAPRGLDRQALKSRSIRNPPGANLF